MAENECDFKKSWDRSTKSLVDTNECDGEVDWICDDCEREGILPGKCPGAEEVRASCGHESCDDWVHSMGEFECRQHQYLHKDGHYKGSGLGWPR